MENGTINNTDIQKNFALVYECAKLFCNLFESCGYDFNKITDELYERINDEAKEMDKLSTRILETTLKVAQLNKAYEPYQWNYLGKLINDSYKYRKICLK